MSCEELLIRCSDCIPDLGATGKRVTYFRLRTDGQELLAMAMDHSISLWLATESPNVVAASLTWLVRISLTMLARQMSKISYEIIEFIPNHSSMVRYSLLSSPCLRRTEVAASSPSECALSHCFTHVRLLSMKGPHLRDALMPALFFHFLFAIRATFIVFESPWLPKLSA